jgi:probable HAF family extracellular repeat protein
VKSTTSMLITVTTLFAALATPTRLRAQDNSADNNHQHFRYKLIDLGTLGGPQSYVNEPPDSFAAILNKRGMVTDWADTSTPDPYPSFCFDQDCLVAHAFQWDDGHMSDLGVLPNGASSASTWISENGLISGFSQNGQIDPLISGLPEVHAVLWRNGGIADLGTLEGGFESLATAVNSRGHVVGWSTNTVPDPFPVVDGGASQGSGFQTRAFLWHNGAMEDLGTLGTGTDATAWLLNERGQVAGDSFTNTTLNTANTCGQNVPTQDPFIWDQAHGLTDIGSLGGTCGFGWDLNNRGQVVGASDLAGGLHHHAFLWDRQQHPNLKDLGTFGGGDSAAFANNDDEEITGWAALPGDKSIHAFLWKHGSMTDLGAVGSDPCSLGFSINSGAQVVGISVPGCDFNNNPAYHAFLWEDGGPMVDLNTLVPPGSALHLTDPDTINDRGEIAGFGFLPNGDQHAFLLIPCDGEHSDAEGCEDAAEWATAAQGLPSQRPRVALAENVGKMLRRRPGFGRFVGNPQKAALNGEAAVSGPNANLSPTSLTFSTQAIGTMSAPKIVVLKNTGTASLKITNIAITGTNARDFAQTHTCGSSLAAGASCSISVTFKPTASGTQTAALSITDNALGSPQKVSLSGTGTAGRCTRVGQQCPPQFPPCCPGLVCQFAGNRAFCEPKRSENTFRTNSYWDQLNANKLE